MIRALLLCAGLIAMTCVGRAQTPTLPDQSKGGGPKVQTICSDADTFAKAVKVLKLPFVKDAKNMPYGDIVGPELQPKLREVYNLAPQFFKGQLCELTGIFITR